MEHIYRISGMNFSYVGTDCLFSGLSIDIPAGGLTLITGSNGAGKTTLCRLLSGLIKKYEGSLLLQGNEVSAMTQAAIMESIIYIKQDLTGNLMGITVEDDLKIWQNRFSDADSHERSGKRRTALAKMGIEKLAAIPNWELSYGQKRCTMLSVLPLYMEKYWIIDEPTASLDEKGIQLLIELTRQKMEKHCGLLVLTHRPEIFTPLAGHIFRLEKGRIR